MDFWQQVPRTLYRVIVNDTGDYCGILVLGNYESGSFEAVMANAQSMAGYFSLTQIHDAATGTASPYGS